jgi:putative transposase
MHRDVTTTVRVKLHSLTEPRAYLDWRACLPVDEYDASVTWWQCGSQNASRAVQGQFECDDCGLDGNADKNGASNIGQRAAGKNIQSPLSTAGAVVVQPQTVVVLKGTDGEMDPANFPAPKDVGLSLSERSPRR